MKFSILLSTYHATNSHDLAKCLDSLCNQTLQADEIIAIKDGPIPEDSEHCLLDYSNRLPIRILEYPVNRGLGVVLQEGLLHCSHDLVARVDTDDECLPNRFSTQVNFLINNADISALGGGLQESFKEGNNTSDVVRNGPTTSLGVIKSAKRRNPINHPTVMFRKNDVLICGGYEKCELFEDYLLWAKMLRSGFELTNLPNVLVKTVVDKSYFYRRGGASYILKEIYFSKKLRQIGFFSYLDSFYFLMTRIPLRVLPPTLRRSIYRYCLRSPQQYI